MGIRMELSSSEQQAMSTSKNCEEILDYIEKLKQVVTTIENELTNMSGKGIQSLQDFITSLIVPYLDSVSLVIHEIGESVEELPKEYVNHVDSRSWSEEELQAKIDECERQINSLENIIISTTTKFSDSRKTKEQKEKIKDKAIDSLEALKVKAEMYHELLEKLRDFDANSSRIFGSISEYQKLSNMGKIAIKDGYNSKKQQYELPINNQEWQQSVISSMANEIGYDTNKATENVDSTNTLIKYFQKDYIDNTGDALAILADSFFRYGYVLKEAKTNSKIKSVYQQKLMTNVWNKGEKIAQIGVATRSISQNIKQIGRILYPLDFYSKYLINSSIGEAVVGTIKDVATAYASEIAVAGIAAALGYVEVPVSMGVGMGFAISNVLTYLHNRVYENSPVVRNFEDSTVKWFDSSVATVKQIEKTNKYDTRKINKFLDDKGIRLQDLPNANNQKTYYNYGN